MTASLSPETQELYAAIGFALTRWSSLEHALCQLYCHLINRRNAFPAAYAFWAVVAFEGKLRMTDAIARVQLQTLPKLEAEWNALNNRIIEKNKNRNRLAHGTVVTKEWRDDSGADRSDTYFRPFAFKRHNDDFMSYEEMVEKKRDPRPDDRLYAKEILEIAKGFDSANKRLHALSNAARMQESELSAFEPGDE